jgi:hypothetical protein
MASETVDITAAPLGQKRLESAVATALKQLATEHGALLTSANALYDWPARHPDTPLSTAHLRALFPAQHVKIIESSTHLAFDQVAPGLTQCLRRAIDLAAADRMSIEQTMSAMERLIRSDRVELFSRGLTL